MFMAVDYIANVNVLEVNIVLFFISDCTLRLFSLVNILHAVEGYISGGHVASK